MHTVRAAVFAILTIGGVGQASGQSAASAERNPALEAERDAAVVTEVVVTAQKRVERLQDVPVSVQVIDGGAIARNNQTSLLTLAETTPGLHIGTGGPSNTMIIRGIGSSGNQAFDQSVGLFVDDIYHGRSRTSQALFLDVERVEVLKGPQATYFGNNAIAGAISLVSRKPGKTFSANTRALYGQHGQYALEAALGGPLSDTFGVRVAAVSSGGNGWIDNITTGRKVPKSDNVGGRVTLSFDPGESLQATLKVEGGRSELRGASFGGPFQLVNCPVPATWPSFFGPICAQPAPKGLDKDTSIDSGTARNRLSTAESVLTLDYEHWNHTFTSVTGYYDYTWSLDFPSSEGPSLGTTTFAPEHAHQFSQELRVASAAGKRIEYLAGLYFQSAVANFALGNTYTGFSTATSDPLFPYLSLAKNAVNVQHEDSYAAFGGLTFNVSERLKLITGLRATRVRKDFDREIYYGRAMGPFGNVATGMPFALQLQAASTLGQQTPIPPVSVNADDSALLPSAKIQYQLTPQAMGYLSYARGFKAGGFNGSDTTNDPANFPFSPEHVNAYELGLKSEWFDHRVLLNAAVFRSDYSGLQVGFFVPDPSGGSSSSLIRNAGASQTQGVETELQWVPSEAFRLSANVTWLDAKYTDYKDGSGTITQIFRGVGMRNISGQETAFAPRWSGSVTASYGANLTANLRFSAHISPYFTSQYNLMDIAETIDGELIFGQRGYVRWDARLGLESQDGRWALDVIGKNLNNRIVVTSYGSLFTASKLEPRNVAAQVRFNW